MTKSRLKKISVVIVVLASAVLLIPGSPFYLPELSKPVPLYAGHTKAYWIENLNNPDQNIRLQALRAMGEIGPDANEAVPILTRCLLEDSNWVVRNEAAFALSKMAAPAAVPALAQALDDTEPIVRLNACLALSRLKKQARPALPALIKAMKDQDNDTNASIYLFTIQEIAALSVGRASAGTADGVPDLVETLSSARTSDMRRAVVRALGEIGSAANPAVPQLRALLRRTNTREDVKEAAEDALAAIGVDPKEQTGAADDNADIELATAEREYLWDIEHHGNLLVKHGFGPFAAALKNADRTALARMLADDFAGADLREPHLVRSVTEFAKIERLDDSGTAATPLRRANFIERLLELRQTCAGAPPQVRLALMTLGPKQRRQLDGIWAGTAQLRMYGERTQGAPAEVIVHLRFEAPRPSLATLSGTGWLRSAQVLQVLSGQAPKSLFAEVAQHRGLKSAPLHDNWTASAFKPVTGGVYVCDFDRDGILDVLVTDVNVATLYRGLGQGHFEEVTARVGLPKGPVRSGATAWVDIDGDGWEDLILEGRVFYNNAGRRFEAYSKQCNLALPDDTSGISVADFDRDGRLDLYVTRTGRPGEHSWLDGRSGGGGGNFLFHNLGNWKFEDVTKASGTRGGYRSTFTAAWLDANNDGWPDLHVINEFGDGVLLVNNHNGAFAANALSDRPADFGSMGLAVGDINNDGHIDIYCANMYSKAGARVIGNLAADAYPPKVMEKMRRFVAGSQLHLNQGNLKFEQVGKKMQIAAVGWAYGACLADLDNDGFLDVYATAGYVSRDRNEPDG